jgi:hypothetical protein
LTQKTRFFVPLHCARIEKQRYLPAQKEFAAASVAGLKNIFGKFSKFFL